MFDGLEIAQCGNWNHALNPVHDLLLFRQLMNVAAKFNECLVNARELLPNAVEHRRHVVDNSFDNLHGKSLRVRKNQRARLTGRRWLCCC